MLIISRVLGKIAARPIVKRLKNKVCFKKKTNYYLLRWIILLAGFALSLHVARIPWCLVLPKEGGYEWFYDKADPVSDAPFSIVTWRGSGPETQNDRIIGMNLWSDLLWVICFRKATAAWCSSSSPECFLVVSNPGRLERVRIYRIISVKGLLLLFCSHLKHLKMSPVVQHVSVNDKWLVPRSFSLDFKLGLCINTIYTSQCCKNFVSEYMTLISPELQLVPLLARICCIMFILKVFMLF